MSSLQYLLLTFFDTLMGHIVYVLYLLAVTGEREVGRRLKKLPPLLLSPLTATLLALGLHAFLDLKMIQYFITSAAILAMCTLWVRWAWGLGAWQALAAACLAGIFQVADSTLTMTLSWVSPLDGELLQYGAGLAVHLGISIAAVLLLYRLRFGRWFCLLLDDGDGSRRTALLLLALEAAMELFLRLAGGVETRFLVLYYLLVAVTVSLMAALVVYLARQFDASRKLQAQRDAIAQQQLYERDLEDIRREVRAFRHDYKNLLAGLSQQAGAGELEQLRASLAELDAGFDQRLGEKIQAAAQIGNLQIPQVRSLLFSKLAAMGERGVACRLEVLYPVAASGMDTWDLVRCLGILIDNAREAVEGTEDPWVEILLLAREGRLDIRVSNPWRGGADPACFWEEGWSTKGPGRGLGLSGYLRILSRYPNASPCTSWAEGMFVQELTIGGKI